MLGVVSPFAPPCYPPGIALGCNPTGSDRNALGKRGRENEVEQEGEKDCCRISGWRESQLWGILRALDMRNLIIRTLGLVFLSFAARAEDTTAPSAVRPDAMASPDGSGWFGTVRGGVVHQFESSVDGGGAFHVNRFAIVGGVGYRPDFTKSVSLSVGYDWNDYGFSGVNGGSPWGDVHTLKLGAPVRWGFDEHWTLFVIPTLRWNAEDGANWGKALSGGGFAGFSYRFGDRLTIGPGFGAVTQLEESPSFFPVLIVQWDITDQLRLETGRGLGASQGPGLSLAYSPVPKWEFSLGGRYEKFRFRLSESNVNADGVGEDRGVPLYLGVTWKWSAEGSVSLLGGVRLSGKLELDNPTGSEIAGSDYDAAPFLGFAFDWRI